MLPFGWTPPKCLAGSGRNRYCQRCKEWNGPRRQLPLRPVCQQNKTRMIDIGKKTRLLAWLSAVPFLTVIFMFEILPLVAVAANSAFREDELSLGNYVEILLSKFFMGSFRVSFSISAATAVIALLVALPAAVVLRRMPGRV